jgi:pimeloyl-ACP methyl ester carboxylesterase
VVTTFTPPGSFPHRTTGARLTQGLRLQFGPAGGLAWGGIPLLLVRPPVLLVHGLMGNEKAFLNEYVHEFVDSFAVYFADYGSENVSGFDRIYSALPREINRVLRGYRDGNHQWPGRRESAGLHLPELRGRHIAATKVDIIAHSMGGLATRWYITEALEGTPLTPRFITYPASSGLGTINGTGFRRLVGTRPPEYRFRRLTNFMRGDIRKIVTQGSPQLGSPLGNYVIHDLLHDDYANVNGQAAVIFDVIAHIGEQAPENSLYGEFGHAIYDLSQGSSANALLQYTPPEPVPVHAIASVTLPQDPDWLVLIGSFFEEYCPNFSAATSDTIVPLRSALYGAVNHTMVFGLTHGELNKLPPVAEKISDELLFDFPGNTDEINSFDAAFPVGGDANWPLECDPAPGGE